MSNKVNIAVVQFKWKIEDYKSPFSFQNRIDCMMKDIRSKINNSYPLLAAFPEYIGTPMLLFGSYDLIKNKYKFSQAVNSIIYANLPAVLRYKLRYGVSFIRALLLSKSVEVESNYTSIFSRAAKKYNAHIAAGSVTIADIKEKNGKKLAAGPDVYNMSFLFGPDGNIIGSQKKVYLVDFERKSGFDLSKGKLKELNVFHTPFGSVGIAVCLDAFKEDVCDKLSNDGADILVQPSANNGQWSEWQQTDWLNGCYLAAYRRKKFKYALNPMMNGRVLDLGFEGQSSIISSTTASIKNNYTLLSPIEGFVSISKHHDTEEILVSTIEV